MKMTVKHLGRSPLSQLFLVLTAASINAMLAACGPAQTVTTTTAPRWLTKEMQSLSNEQLMQEVNAIRIQYHQSIALQGEAEAVAEVRDSAIPTEDHRVIPVRIYIPKGSATRKRPLVVFFHGGGFFSGDLDTHDIMLRHLTNVSEAEVISVDYGLAPEHPFPAGLEDCYAAVLWASTNADKLGIDPTKIATAGDSAGGNLSTGVVQMIRDRGGPKLTMQVLFYPTTAGIADTPTREQFRAKALIDTHYIALVTRAYIASPGDDLSPLFASLRSDPKGVPPTLVISAGMDTLRDEGEQYAEMLKAAGVNAQWVRYADATHGFTQYYGQAGAGMAGRLSLDEGAMALKAAFALKLIP
jgi:acetyl esterase